MRDIVRNAVCLALLTISAALLVRPLPSTADKISYEVGDILATDHKVWFSLPRIGALVYTEATGCAYKVTLNRAVFPGAIQPDALTIDSTGHLWFADLLAHRVGYVGDKGIASVGLPSDILPIISLAAASDGSVWAVPGFGREIVQLKNGAIVSRHILTDSPVRFSSVTSIPSGIAAATETGLLIYNPHSHSIRGLSVAKTTASIRMNGRGDIAFFIPNEHRIAAITNSGKRWTTSVENDVTALAVTSSAAFFVSPGLLSTINLSDGAVTNVPFQHRGVVTRLVVDRDGRIWYATTSDELGYFADNRDHPYEIGSQLLSTVGSCNASVGPA